MKIAWLASTQPPYREPMWREVAALVDLEVSVIRAEERTRHFVWTPKPGYRSSLIPNRVLPLPRRLARHLDEPAILLRAGQTPRLLRGADAVIFGVWWQPANLWTALRARIRGIPYLIYAESTLQSRQFSRGPAARVRSLLFRNAGAVLVPGPDAAAAAIADGAAPERIVESGNSVDLDLFHRRVRELRSERQPPSGPHRFVYVGQLIERKNVDGLLHAFATLDGTPTLDVAGDGARSAELASLARDLGITDRVRFLGFRSPDEVVELLVRAHTLVLPSTEEVYGYTALEAYVAGLHVVVSTRTGVAGTLEGRPGTWLVEPSVDGLRSGLGAARAAWTGWRDHDVEFASPRRAAREIVRAAEEARYRPAGQGSRA